jgi:hypothetical protein
VQLLNLRETAHSADNLKRGGPPFRGGQQYKRAPKSHLIADQLSKMPS